MTHDQLIDLLKNYLKQIAPESDPGALKEEDPIRQKLGMDSFDFLQFIIRISDTLKIAIPEEDYGKVLTLKDLADYIVKTEEVKKATL